ncbi:MAG: uracil-DNA glycosylase [Telmatospirillum sp.]|nr:uracil-DNA glycosylase [Telmatospirillum sp.]
MILDHPLEPMTPAQILRWYLEAGVDETIGESAVDRFALSSRPAAPAAVATDGAFPAGPGRTPQGERPASSLAGMTASLPGSAPLPETGLSAGAAAARETARRRAASCDSRDALRTALESYDGCPLKRTCQRTVFGDGRPGAELMLIGEAPGADEDRQGLPFVGASGRLLDRMLASIGIERTAAYITNVVPWRPPGNRKPEPTEVELCLPFIVRHIELVRPRLLVFLGGAPATALLARTDAISRLRGRWFDYRSDGLDQPVPAIPTYHPAYLLRTPIHKREAWSDFLSIRKRLSSHAEIA